MEHEHDATDSPIVEAVPDKSLRDAFAESAVAPRFACGHPDIPPFSFYNRPGSPDEMCGICLEIGPTQLHGEPLPTAEDAAKLEAANIERKAAFAREVAEAKPPEFDSPKAFAEHEEAVSKRLATEGKAGLRNADQDDIAAADAKAAGESAKPARITLPKGFEPAPSAIEFVPPSE